MIAQYLGQHNKTEVKRSFFLNLYFALALAALFRCMEMASLPLYASFFAAAVNTVLNYFLIFGQAGFPAMGAVGAAIATVISQFLNFALLLIMCFK